MEMNLPLQKTITGKQASSFLGPKILTKVSNSTKSIKTTASFTYALEREI